MTTTTLGPGAKLKAAREQSGMSRADVAAALGLTYQRIADIESERWPISLEKILQVCEAIGCDPHAIDPRLASVA